MSSLIVDHCAINCLSNQFVVCNSTLNQLCVPQTINNNKTVYESELMIRNSVQCEVSIGPNEYPSESEFPRVSGARAEMSVKSLSGGVFRPRGALARTLYDKHQNDCKLREVDKTEWYLCNRQKLSDTANAHFYQLHPDPDTRSFISDSIEKSSWVWTQLWHCMLKSFLGFFMSRTDINGWLGRGSMFVLSSDQLTELISPVTGSRSLTNRGYAKPWTLGTLLDLGAGDGEVTKRWASLFSHLYATEISASMRKMLETKGFQVLDFENWWLGKKYNVITMLNLLDRCSEPRTMMLTARESLEDDGLIIVALVLPFKPYVEYTTDHYPTERMPIKGSTFEEQVSSFLEYVRDDIGLDIVRWSRVPYLCEGDINQSYYWLDDAIFVFKKNPNFTINNST